MRWIVSYARDRREHTMAQRLANELLDAGNGVGASVKRREDLQKMAESNKAFAQGRLRPICHVATRSAHAPLGADTEASLGVHEAGQARHQRAEAGNGYNRWLR